MCAYVAISILGLSPVAGIGLTAFLSADGGFGTGAPYPLIFSIVLALYFIILRLLAERSAVTSALAAAPGQNEMGMDESPGNEGSA